MTRKNKPRIIFGAGGTGGHLFPAQAVAHQLKDQCECLFVGGLLSQNRFFNREKFPYKEIKAAPLALHPQKLFKLLRGTKESYDILKEFQPDLVIGFGSYFTFPLLAAAALKKIPIFLHEQNALPGRVNRLFSPMAATTAISFPKTYEFLSGKNIHQVAFPIRPKTGTKDPWTYYGLEKDKPTILAFGGSQGAKVLNHLFMESMEHLPQDVQVIHFTGDIAFSDKARAHYRKLGKKCVVKEFEEEMDCALTIADVALTRAGASTVAELGQWELPAVLIPFPHAKDNHQYENALHFVETMKGGKLLFQEETTPLNLAEALIEQLHEKEDRKKTMRDYNEGQKLSEFSTLILDYLKNSKSV